LEGVVLEAEAEMTEGLELWTMLTKPVGEAYIRQ